ncbi:hypothetical protein QBC44DRAFT_59636 [Cladorrhinum sp. PSN332]|nr:hypothetical protein QBC44DRAFT_59636 [Cladorrhinum sp. PSN332]
MAQPKQPSLGSNNPFRRKAVPAVASGSSAPPPPPTFPDADADADTPAAAPAALPSGDEFWNHLQGGLSRPSQPPPTTSFQKPKVVKRVRVQSPPPSSPESAGGPRRVEEDSASNADSDSESVESAERLDPFTGASAAGPGAETWTREEVVIPISTYGTPPPNPFQSTARDLQSSGTPGSGGAKAGLDVNAFGRLLLTGQTGGTAPAAQHIAHQMAMGVADPASNTTTDASSESRQSSIFDPPRLSQDHTPRTSHEVSEQEAGDEKQGLIARTPSSSLQPAPTILRKKPPPPSSRHGKLIRPESSQPSPSTSRTPITSPTPRDINKPLPFSPEVEETANIFDHSAAGKVPEPRPPTPPQPSKKPAPPAPRRQPHRQQSSSSSATALTPNLDDHDSLTRRSSVDSVRSRSSSLRVSLSHAVPPPAPPPRRPAGHGRGLSSSLSSPPPPPLTSPGGTESYSAETPLSGLGVMNASVVNTPPQISGGGTPDGTATAGSGSISVNMHHLHSKLSPPPPPPARNLSVRTGTGRRPVSLSERKGSGSGLKSPPPPVPKHRGEVGGAGSVGSVKTGGGGGGGGGDAEQSVDILADLTRLQREVDALRAGLVVEDGVGGGSEVGKRSGSV